MPNPLVQAGALAAPSKLAPIYVNRVYTGLYTQRNPLREGGITQMYEKFYAGSRFDSLIDGSNAELNARLDWERRPGLSVYNNQTFPAINRFYDLRLNCSGTPSIKVMADTATIVYNATGPSTKTAIFTKSMGAGSTYFKSVGNILYMGNGVDQVKWDGCAGGATTGWGIAAPVNAPINRPLAYLGAPTRYWANALNVVPGYTILDSNGNIQLMTGNVSSSNTLTTTLRPTTILNGWGNNAHVGDYEGGVDEGHQYPPLGLNNDTTYPYVNPNLAVDSNPETAATVSFTSTHKYAGCVWQFAYSGPAPTLITLNILSEVPSGSGTRLRDAGIFYSLDGGTTWTRLYQATGRTKRWDTLAIPPGTTISNIQILAFTDSHDDMAHSVYDINLVVSRSSVDFDLTSGALTTGATFPAWNSQLFGNTVDGTAIWLNLGPPSQWQANFVYSLDGPSAAIVDTNGNLQIAENTGLSGATQPVWATSPGATTTDGTITWLNTGPGTILATTGWKWVYAFYASAEAHASTASPESTFTGPVIGLPFTQNGSGVPLSGSGSADAQANKIRIYRTTDGGSTFLQDADTTNPGASMWTYTDQTLDSALTIEIQAAVAHDNDPAPVGAINTEYHMGRLWVSVGTHVYYNRTRSAVDGDPLQSFPPDNVFSFPSTVRRLFSCTIGLIVFTESDNFVILGRGTDSDPFYSPGTYLKGFGLLSYDAFAVNGSTPYFMSSARKLIAFDPGAGVIEPGFPIGDQFKKVTTAGFNSALFSPSTSFVSWHEASSGDTALYVCDGSHGWFRMSASATPESGQPWSPFAALTGGCSAVQSLETAPGVHDLLVGPASSGNILKRDSSVNTDNGSTFAWYITIGNIVLAQPTEVAELAFITLDSLLVGKRPTVGVLLGEISGTFDTLKRSRQDPPLLPPGKTLYNDRYYFAQDQSVTYCRHLQLKLAWIAQDFHEELLTYTIVGSIRKEKG